MGAQIKITLAALVLAGCDYSSQTGKNVARWEYDLLSNRVKGLEEYRWRRFVLENSEATLNPNDTGYSLIDTDLGTLTLQITEVQPSANGSKVKIRIGNPTSANISVMTANIAWGPLTAENASGPETGQHNRYELTDIPAGRWTHKTIPLADLPPDRLGYIRFSGTVVESITLLNRD